MAKKEEKAIVISIAEIKSPKLFMKLKKRMGKKDVKKTKKK